MNSVDSYTLSRTVLENDDLLKLFSKGKLESFLQFEFILVNNLGVRYPFHQVSKCFNIVFTAFNSHWSTKSEDVIFESVLNSCVRSSILLLDSLDTLASEGFLSTVKSASFELIKFLEAFSLDFIKLVTVYNSRKSKSKLLEKCAAVCPLILRLRLLCERSTIEVDMLSPEVHHHLWNISHRIFEIWCSNDHVLALVPGSWAGFKLREVFRNVGDNKELPGKRTDLFSWYFSLVFFLLVGVIIVPALSEYIEYVPVVSEYVPVLSQYTKHFLSDYMPFLSGYIPFISEYTSYSFLIVIIVLLFLASIYMSHQNQRRLLDEENVPGVDMALKPSMNASIDPSTLNNVQQIILDWVLGEVKSIRESVELTLDDLGGNSTGDDGSNGDSNLPVALRESKDDKEDGHSNSVALSSSSTSSSSSNSSSTSTANPTTNPTGVQQIPLPENVAKDFEALYEVLKKEWSGTSTETLTQAQIDLRKDIMQKMERRKAFVDSVKKQTN